MKKHHFLLIATVSLAAFYFLQAPFAQASTVLSDDFLGARLNANLWHIPSAPTPAGRTQYMNTTMPVPYNKLPGVANSTVQITLQTYDPFSTSNFLGTQMISNQSFSLNHGVDVKIRAKMFNVNQGGIVGGLYLYALKADGSHDVVDFKLLSNTPGGDNLNPTQVWTDLASYEPTGPAYSAFVSYPSGGTINDWHTYEIRWFPDRVTWLIDGLVVRTTIDPYEMPEGPMNFYATMYVPGSGWPEAYDADLQPNISVLQNFTYVMNIDSVTVDNYTTDGLPGDVNDDGIVNSEDADIVSANFGSSTKLGASAGDLNNDGVVDFADFAIMSNNMTNFGPGVARMDYWPDVATPTTDSSTSPNVSGTVHVSTTLSSNTGVDGVQFFLDNYTNIGSEVTTPPFTVALDTTTLIDGIHTISAVAVMGDHYTESDYLIINVDNNTSLTGASTTPRIAKVKPAKTKPDHKKKVELLKKAGRLIRPK